MKRLFAIAVLLLLAAAAQAQQEVTRFMGIPVDGTEAEMIRKLEEKGYCYDARYDRLEGKLLWSRGRH